MNWLMVVYSLIGVWCLFLRAFFLINEGLYQTPLFVVDLLLLIFCLAIGLHGGFKNKINKKIGSINFFGFLLLIVLVFSVFKTYKFNFEKKVIVGYDSIALYDARAKYLAAGVKFKDMNKILEFDVINKNYYSVYPPFTSLVHFFWRKWLPNISVSLIYSSFLTILGIVVFMSITSYFPRFLSLLIVFLLLLNPAVYSLSLVEYTNLPFLLFFVIAVLCCLSYLYEKKSYYMYLASFFLSCSVWTRQTEPLWLAVAVAMVVVCLGRLLSRKTIISLLFLFLTPLFTYMSWGLFISKLNDRYVMSFGLPIFVSALSGIINGNLLNVLILILKAWIAVLPIFILSFFATVTSENERRMILFLKLIEALSMFIYIGGIYLFSFQSYWWTGVVNDSLMRSSISLLIAPLIIFGIKLKDYAKKTG